MRRHKPGQGVFRSIILLLLRRKGAVGGEMFIAQRSFPYSEAPQERHRSPAPEGSAHGFRS